MAGRKQPRPHGFQILGIVATLIGVAIACLTFFGWNYPRGLSASPRDTAARSPSSLSKAAGVVIGSSGGDGCLVFNNSFDVRADTVSPSQTGVVVGPGTCGNDFKIKSAGPGTALSTGSQNVQK